MTRPQIFLLTQEIILMSREIFLRREIYFFIREIYFLDGKYFSETGNIFELWDSKAYHAIMKSSITVLLDCLGMAAGGEDADGGKVALLRHWFVSQEQRLSPTLWGPRHRPGDSEAILPGLVAGVSQQFDHSGLVTA